jgi:hypothetical protein
VVSEANRDKNSDNRLMRHRPNPSCWKRLLAANVDRPVILGEDETVEVRKLTPIYAGYVNAKDGKAVVSGTEAHLQSVSVEEAARELDALEATPCRNPLSVNEFSCSGPAPIFNPSALISRLYKFTIEHKLLRRKKDEKNSAFDSFVYCGSIYRRRRRPCAYGGK